MNRFTYDWLASYEARRMPKHRVGSSAPDPGPESDLHEKILAECRRRGWKAVHSRMDAPTTIGEGVVDFIIYADRGRMFHIECKSSKGKLSLEQQAFIAWISKLGHAPAVVDSFQQFLEIISQ